MPEIRLGSIENMVNINLGSIEMQEIYLGANLVWQNNQGPMFQSVTFDGMNFVANADGQVMGSDSVFAGSASGFTDRQYSFVFNNITDPDNADENTDFIVGYRIRRPDGTWFAGDPQSTDPVTAEFGVLISGVTYDADTDTFTGASRSLASLSTPIMIRPIDSSGNNVTSTSQQFADDGVWSFFVVDSRGGDSPMADIDVDVNYQQPNGGISFASGNNPANTQVGGPSTTTMNFSASVGPISSVQWQTSSGTNIGSPVTSSPYTSPSISVPQHPSRATFRAIVTGYGWDDATDGPTNALTATITSPSIGSQAPLTAPTRSITAVNCNNYGGSLRETQRFTSTNSIGSFVRWEAFNGSTWVNRGSNNALDVTGTCPTCGSVGTLTNSTFSLFREIRNVSGSEIASPTAPLTVNVSTVFPDIAVNCSATNGTFTTQGMGNGGTTTATVGNVTGAAVRAINCAGTLPSSWTDTIAYGVTIPSGFTFSSNEAVSDTSDSGNATCSGSGTSGTFTVNPALHRTQTFVPPLPTFTAPTPTIAQASAPNVNCNISCSTGSPTQSSISQGTSANITCIGTIPSGFQNAGASFTGPTASLTCNTVSVPTGEQLIIRAPSGAVCRPTSNQTWEWTCGGVTQRQTMTVGDANVTRCIDTATFARSIDISDSGCFGSTTTVTGSSCNC